MKHLMKKAVKAAVFATLTTLALTAFASAEGEMAIGAGCTTGTSLRMRSEPNTSSAIVTTLNKSVAVALLDDSVPGWYKINYNGSTGGTDIIAAIVNKYKDVSLGRMIMICDVSESY